VFGYFIVAGISLVLGVVFSGSIHKAGKQPVRGLKAPDLDFLLACDPSEFIHHKDVDSFEHKYSGARMKYNSDQNKDNPRWGVIYNVPGKNIRIIYCPAYIERFNDFVVRFMDNTKTEYYLSPPE
tara:strand:+ start:108 stop:482 length:375 start_codon:yes stop_codon:yes gene_type:complete